MLVTDAQQVNDRLAYLDAAGSGFDEAKRLEERRKELEQRGLRLQELVSRSDMLRAAGILTSVPPEVAAAREAVSRAATLFRNSRQANVLTQGSRWVSLVGKLDSLASAFDALQRQDWKAHVSTKLFGGLSPEDRRKTLNHNHPGNKNAIERYSKLYAEFNRFRNTIPPNSMVLHDVLAASIELSEIKFEESKDMSAAVQRFLDATGSGAGANLELLTTEVIEWLRTSGLQNSYVVRAKF